MAKKQLSTHTFYIQGIHCPACEILINETLAECEQVKAHSLSVRDLKVTLVFAEPRLADSQLALYFIQKLFTDSPYTFSLAPTTRYDWKKLGIGVAIALAIGAIFMIAGQQQWIAEPTLNDSSPWGAFFIFGLLASVSSCAALVGGIVLTLAKSWFSEGKPKWQPVAVFQTGRIAGFALGGLGLGLAGSFFQLDPMLNAILLLVVALLMIITGLDFLGLPIWRRLFKSSRLFTPRVSQTVTSWWMPAVVGALTFFIPCGFTTTVQLLAVAAGNPLKAASLLIAFVLGTVPMLSLIAYSGSAGQGKKQWQQILNYTIGALIVIFGLVNLNTQLLFFGLPNFSDLNFGSSAPAPTATAPTDDLIPMEAEVQVLKLTATANGYRPTRVKMRANTPTRLEIDVQGTSGCSNAIIAPDFFEGRIPLVTGEKPTKEFVSPAPGKYKITCWMRMITVNVEVV